jgi:hypothetical protein
MPVPMEMNIATAVSASERLTVSCSKHGVLFGRLLHLPSSPGSSFSSSSFRVEFHGVRRGNLPQTSRPMTAIVRRHGWGFALASRYDISKGLRSSRAYQTKVGSAGVLFAWLYIRIASTSLLPVLFDTLTIDANKHGFNERYGYACTRSPGGGLAGEWQSVLLQDTPLEPRTQD